MDVAPQTLASLGFDELQRALAGRARSELGRSRALARPFLDSADAVRAALALVEEARRLRGEPLALPLAGLIDLRGALARAALGAMLEPTELVAVCRALFAFERCAEILEERRLALPGLHAVSRRLPLLPKLATRLDRSFEPNGELSDRASDALRELRGRVRGLHRRIRARLDELLQSEAFAVNLQERYFSVRSDRYVVPVKSSHQREVDGIVHNASQTGQTLFVEPKELILLGNELAVAQSLVLEEERRVLLELSGLVGREAAPLAAGIEAAAELDELEAAAHLADELLASAPELEAADGPLDLRGLRHPRLVLKGDAVVANDVSLAGEARTLVVSGPNAGGKTVTLTGVGLCALLTRCGLPIPCDAGSRIPLFEGIQAAVGDQQDLQHGLSTFSAHVTTLRDILATARRGTLVLVDEIAADTDPREGAAIATAVLEALLTRGALVLVTTHLEELKALAHLDRRFVNARVGFDARRMAPTFKLQLGAAGASSAVEIARRVGLPAELCDRAAALVRDAGGVFSKALAETEAERGRLAAEREAQAQAAAEAQALAATLQAQLEAARRERLETEARFREALKAELDYAKVQLRTLLERLELDRSDTAKRTLEAARAELHARAEEQAAALRLARAELSGPKAPGELAPLRLEPGARAFHPGLGADVEILDVAGDAVLVALGALKTRVAASALEAPRGGPKGPRGSHAGGGGPSQPDAQSRAEAVRAAPVTLACPRIDVRGQRVDEALRNVEQLLDRALREGHDAALVLHGHGTGALKATLRDALAKSPYARAIRPGDAAEGGDAVTVVSVG